jgi:hypothetical protein
MDTVRVVSSIFKITALKSLTADEKTEGSEPNDSKHYQN